VLQALHLPPVTTAAMRVRVSRSGGDRAAADELRPRYYNFIPQLARIPIVVSITKIGSDLIHECPLRRGIIFQVIAHVIDCPGETRKIQIVRHSYVEEVRAMQRQVLILRAPNCVFPDTTGGHRKSAAAEHYRAWKSRCTAV
jgi:hypothetical protein